MQVFLNDDVFVVLSSLLRLGAYPCQGPMCFVGMSRLGDIYFTFGHRLGRKAAIAFHLIEACQRG